MENIKITKITSKTTSGGKPYKMCEVEYQGKTERVNIWSNAPDFANLQEGSIMVGKMTKEGQYWNISFGDDKPRGGAGSAFKTAQIETTMARKEGSIAKFQDNKEFSIMVASSMSGAIALACAEYKDKTVLDTLDRAVLKWRQFILDNWNVDPKDIKPF